MKKKIVALSIVAILAIGYFVKPTFQDSYSPSNSINTSLASINDSATPQWEYDDLENKN